MTSSSTLKSKFYVYAFTEAHDKSVNMLIISFDEQLILLWLTTTLQINEHDDIIHRNPPKYWEWQTQKDLAGCCLKFLKGPQFLSGGSF